MLCKGNPYFFFGKEICNLTNYQISLANYGNGFKGTLEHCDSTPPYCEDIDDMIAWFDKEKDNIKRKYSSKASKPSKRSNPQGSKKERFEGIGVPDASEDEVFALGMEKDAVPTNLIEAAEKLKKKLGKDHLDIKDMVELHK